MAEQPADSRNNNPFLITLFLSLIIGGGYLLYDSPLVSNRNPSSENPDPLTARLWEDPLNTYHAYLEIFNNDQNAEIRQRYVEDINNIQDKLFGNGTQNTVAIIGVVLPEGRYTLTNEVRRRIRYSVISALTLNYEPQSAESINLFEAEEDAYGDDLINVIPYEIYSDWDIYPQDQEDDPAERVLVLWIPASYMQDAANEEDRYHAHLLSLFSRISKDDTNQKDYTSQVVQSTVLGPDNSNEYFTLYNEILRGIEVPPDLKIQYLSPRATVSDAWLTYARGLTPGDANGTDVDISSNLKRTILSDDVLLDSIFDELLRRYPMDEDEARKNLKVALIHEIDTKYSYSISQLLDCNGLEALSGQELATHCFEDVTSFGYLRGIDGVGPGADTGGDDNTNEPETSALLQQGTLETAFGRDQLDYLNRLSQAISSDNYDVIGVIGTDVYDKLLIMQALKQDNPNSLFFTTDLDELFLESTSQKWTRNLLIASAWGLQPTTEKIEECQLNGQTRSFFPPNFRDSYQTAYFLSTCQALQEQDSGYIPFQQGMADIKPVLYEVGRSKFIPLESPTDSGDNLSQDNGSIEGRTMFMLGWTAFFLPVFSLCVLSVALIRRYNLNPDQNRLQIRALKGCFTMSLLVMPGMAVLLLREYLYVGGEPIWPFQSTSNWPVTLLRLQIIFLGFWFLFYGRAKARDNTLFINEKMLGLKSSADKKTGSHPAHKQLVNIARAFADYFSQCRPYLNPRVFFQHLFQEQANHDLHSTDLVSNAAKWYKRVDSDNMIAPAEKSIVEIWEQYLHIIKHICHNSRILDTGIGSASEQHWTYNFKQALQIFLSPLAIVMTIITVASTEIFFDQSHLVRDSYWLANILFSWNFQFLVVLCSYAVIFFCVDMINSMRAFVHAMAKYNVVWNDPVQYFDRYLFGNKRELQGPLSSMDVIAKRAHIIPPFIVLPFILLLLMFWSKSFLFEGYHWSLVMGVIYGGIALYVLLCAYRLHAEIRLSHQVLLKRIHAVEHQTELWKDNGERDAAITLALDCVDQMEQDVFVPWYKHPFFKSLIVPFTGSGGLLLLQAFTN